ncbi:type I restriction enzyme endonuclease domain-containing protein [Caloranaerobacter sp. DY30410]|uniref:type I restriction enzyme endonuclease domain-containing protein n=1 Tax=Caloranaerobacter sp. DY30410 TaxID=3238305 RepID=UPI003D05B3C5
MSVDWNLRESVRAKMRVTIKRLLKKYGYPPDQQLKAIKTVMEQAELMCSNEVLYHEQEEHQYDYYKAADDRETKYL